MAGLRKNIHLFAVFITLILLITQIAVLVSWDRQGGSAEAKSIYVSASGSTYSSLQAAVNAASPYDSIYIAPGTYTEHVSVNKDGLRLIGNDTKTTRINVTNLPSALTLNANYISVSNLNFSVSDANGEGVRVNNVTGVELRFCEFNMTGASSNGIVLNRSMNCIIRDLYFDAEGSAMGLWNASGNEISRCSMAAGDIALMQGSAHNRVSNCTMTGQISVLNSNENTIQDNTIWAAGASGLYLSNANLNYMLKNNLTDCGISISASEENQFNEDRVVLSASAAGSEGIKLSSSMQNAFTGCTVHTMASSGNALNLQSSPSNQFQLCSFETAATSTNAAYASGSDGVYLKNVSITTSGPNSRGLRMYNCQGTTLQGCSFEITGSNPTAIFWEDHCRGTSIDTTFENIYIDPTSNLSVKNYLTIKVAYQNSTTPMPGADVLVQDNDLAVYSTGVYGGADVTTGADGVIGPMLLTDLMFLGSSTPTENITMVQVWKKMDYSLEVVRDVNLKTSHIETFMFPDLVRPLTPQNVTVSSISGKAEMNISWDMVGGDTVSYGVYSNQSGTWKNLANVSQNWYVNQGLEDSTAYFYKVSAWDTLHESYLSPISSNRTPDLTPPPMPQGLVSVVTDTTSLVIGWKKVSAPDLVGYTIYMNTTGGSVDGPFKKVGMAGPEDVTYLISGLRPATTYYFCIDAFDAVPNNSSKTTSLLVITKVIILTKGDIEGIVYYEPDSPKSGPANDVTVTLLSSTGDTIMITTTGNNGIFRFNNITFQNGLTLKAEPPSNDAAIYGNCSGYTTTIMGPFDLRVGLYDGDIYLDHYLYIPPPNVIIKDRGPEGINVSITEEIYVKFSESMNTTSVEMGLHVTPMLVNASFEWATLNRSVRVYHANLTYSTTYTVTLSPLMTSRDGYVFAPDYANLTWNFTTKAKSYVKPNITQPDDDDTGAFSDQQILVLEILGAVAILLIVLAIIVAVVMRHNRKAEAAHKEQPAKEDARQTWLEPSVAVRQNVFSYYEFLGVSRDATTPEIKRAYRHLSKEFHPDKYANPTPEQLMDLKKKQTKLNNAKEVLLDQKKRVLYDISIGHKRADEVVIPADEPAGMDDAIYDIDIRTTKDDDFVEDIPELSVISEPAEPVQDLVIEAAKEKTEEDLAYTLPDDLDEE